MAAVNTLQSPRAIPRPLYIGLATLFVLLWSSAFMAVKIGLRSSPPFFLMGFRFLVAGLLLLGWCALRGYTFPRTRREWVHLIVIGLLNNAAYLGLSALALRSISGGMAAVIASTNPLMLALVAPLFLGERLTTGKAAGFLVAFASVFAVMYSRLGAGDPPWAMGLLFLANALMVTGTVLFKRWTPSQHLTMVNGVQLLSASVALLLPSLLLEPVSAIRWTPSFLYSMAFLVLGVSVGAMLIWFLLLRSGDASRANSFFFLSPVLGLFLGALLLGEPLRPFDFAGAIGVGLGIYMVQKEIRI